MIEAKDFCSILNKYGFGPYTGVPCSILKPVLNYIETSPQYKYYIATSEGEAMGIAAGFNLAGKIPVVLMQNSGIGNAVNPITSLHLIYNLPALLIISLRGEPGRVDAPEHFVMGKITSKLLKVVGLHTEFLSPSIKELKNQIKHLKNLIVQTNKPVALIIKANVFFPAEKMAIAKKPTSLLMQRRDAIKIIIENLNGNELIISTTGMISRELYAIKEKSKNIFYMVGSMGCALPIGLGISQLKPKKKVVILDGDGAVLMKLGSLATVGHYEPANLIHIVLDNEAHDSTGGQSSVSNTAELEKVAIDLGYRYSTKVTTPRELINVLKNIVKKVKAGPHFILIKVLKGADEKTGRVELSPRQIKEGFGRFLRE